MAKKAPCNCKKLTCLKLYCECFRLGAYCDNRWILLILWCGDMNTSVRLMSKRVSMAIFIFPSQGHPSQLLRWEGKQRQSTSRCWKLMDKASECSTVSCIREIEELEANDPDVAERIDDYLESRVVELLREAELEQQERVRERAKEYEKMHQRSPFPVPEIENEEKDKELVLVRLRVEHTGFPVLINQRFGAKFVGKVANPNDILLFHRRKKERINMDFEKPLLSRPVRPTPLVAETIEDILRKQLCIPERKIVLLSEGQLGIALENFTFRSNASAIQEFVDSVLDATQHELSSHRDAKSAKDILSVVEKKMEQTDALDALQKEESELGIDTADSDVASRTNLSAVGFRSKRAMQDDSRVAKAPPGRFGTPLTRSNKVAASKTNTAKVSSIFLDLEDNSDNSPRSKKTSTPPKALARSSRSKQRAKSTSVLFDDDDLSGDDDGDEDYEVKEDAEEEENTSRRTSRGRAAVKKSIPNRKRLRKSIDSNDEGEQDDELIRSVHKTKSVKPAKQASQASDVLKLCSESDPEYSEQVSKPKAKRSRQLKINHLAKNHELKKNEDDDVESDHGFAELARRTDAGTQDIIGPSQSQTASQISQPRGECLTRRSCHYLCLQQHRSRNLKYRHVVGLQLLPVKAGADLLRRVQLSELCQHHRDRGKAATSDCVRLEKNPNAFKPRIGGISDATASALRGTQRLFGRSRVPFNSLLSPSGQLRFQQQQMIAKMHQRGCHCKKSACQKKYCECYQEGVAVARIAVVLYVRFLVDLVSRSLVHSRLDCFQAIARTTQCL
ncbi:hypothetical protein PsorP6_003692 [Peronosclerospora sorghi]|uniref:Uncharacterized protein n=1 Tax=Peronosclerospora sorghi TaxID=230839 RepID=A0ACC0VQG1_9STRA|nr:hypothetical protein PsorP6_003692 [Peronosclerospora sorghi]